jgi:hypothetical protein
MARAATPKVRVKDLTPTRINVITPIRIKNVTIVTKRVI